MVTVEKFLMVHEGRLYELRTDAPASSCKLHYKNGGECQGCVSGASFPKACNRMAHVLGADIWHWKELSI